MTEGRVCGMSTGVPRRAALGSGISVDDSVVGVALQQHRTSEREGDVNKYRGGGVHFTSALCWIVLPVERKGTGNSCPAQQGHDMSKIRVRHFHPP